MKRLIHRPLLAFALGALAIGSAAHAAVTGVESQLQQILHKRFPTVKVDAIEPSAVPGLYQVFTGDHVAYVDASGEHLIVGKMMDTRTMANLSEQAVDTRYAINFNSLPLGEAIKIVRGNGARKLALFEDPDCPFCRQLEQNMSSLTNVTIYLFLFPLEQIHPHALADSKKIWCSPDRASAWTNWMLYRTPIPGGGSCADDPIKKISVLADSLHVTGTPTIYLSTGRRIGHVITTQKLEHLLAQTSGPASAGPATAARLTASKASPN
jgi:thiol:disulfide interchange protein DsbC